MKKKVYIVWVDGGAAIDKIFTSEEKAKEYIMNDKTVIETLKELDESLEEYLEAEPHEVYLGMEEYEVEE